VPEGFPSRQAGFFCSARATMILFASPAKSSVKELIDCFDAKQEVTP
jgi:hypothetical protein